MCLHGGESVAHPVLIFIKIPQLLKRNFPAGNNRVPGNISVGPVHDLQKKFPASLSLRETHIGQKVPADPVLKEIRQLFFHGKGNLPLHKRGDQTLCFLIGAEKDGCILQIFSLFQPLSQFRRYTEIFLSGIRILAEPNRLSLLVGRTQFFLESCFISADHFHGGIQDPFAAPVIHIQNHLLCPGIILREIQHDLRTGAPEMINGLVVVPHDKKIVLRLCQQTDDIILKLIDVLKFIHQDITEFLLPRPKDVLPFIKQFIAGKQHIVKIQLSSFSQHVPVSSVNLAEHFVRTAGGIIMFQGNPVSLDHTDLFRDLFCKIPLRRELAPEIQRQLPEDSVLLFFRKNIG